MAAKKDLAAAPAEEADGEGRGKNCDLRITISACPGAIRPAIWARDLRFKELRIEKTSHRTRPNGFIRVGAGLLGGNTYSFRHFKLG